MKRFLILCAMALLGYNSYSQDNQPVFEIVEYYFVDLITNPDRPALPKEQVDSIQAAHMANMKVMVEEEVLMLAGPFEGGGGLFILKMDSREAVEERVKKDPAIAAGRLNYTIRKWWTTKGSFGVEEQYDKNEK